ncbi:hypothetical protein FNV43_RR20215 [Rhamnella rubrinervis]|uniref:Uncharacterized protein n=1 Tax=Rhamnella rubrinervis TaxID=2594499 RepID=A0A8K0DU08_9ROSA|nr:hypothetical protein FNV43_RR20215 [Rhamnella rubrinervis]
MSTTSSGGASLESQRLLGKVALVTGGASGIGESIVRLFHQHGAKVCLVDLQDNLGHHVCETLGGDPNTCYSSGDVTKEDDVRRAIDFTVGKYGTLDIMVNNAGMSGSPCNDIRNAELLEFEKVFDLNVKGVFLGMKHAARIMIPARKGTIISLSSVSSTTGGLGPHPYTASKHAVLGLTRNVAAELGLHGIRVNCVSPYAVATGLALAHLPEDERTEDALVGFRAFVGKHANLQGVELTVDDVANAVLFLASDESRILLNCALNPHKFMAALQASWLSSLNTISPTKPTLLTSKNVKKYCSFKPFRISYSLNSANDETPQPSSPNSPETTSEAETGPVDPVKLAFAKAKAYKNLAESSPKLKLEQNPVVGTDGTTNGNGGSGLVSDGGSGETKDVPDSIKISMEKAKEHKKNEGVVDFGVSSGQSDTISGLKETSGGISGNKIVERRDDKKGLSVSSIDFVGLDFADKKKSRGLPPGLVPVSDPFPEGDLPEVEFIAGDTSKFEEKMSSKPDQIQGGDPNLYKPKVSSWGVFPRPNNISKTFGGGRVIRPGEVLETAEEKAAKEARTRQLLAAYKSKRGLNIDPELKSECEEALKDGDALMNVGKLKNALPYYEKVMDKMMFQSELHGLAALQWSICQDSLSRPNEARVMYEKLQSHPNAQVSKKARQFMFSFQAMEMMKVTRSPSFSSTGYQNYFNAFIEKKANYPLQEAEVEVGSLSQTLPYIIFLVSPIFIVLLIAVQKRV